MEGYNGGLRAYWKRKRYQRLDGGGRSRRGWRSRAQRHRVELASAGGQADGAGRRRRFWRIKIAPRLGFLRRAVSSPARFLARIRDAYVRMMLRFANSRVFSAGGGLGYYGGDAGVAGFGRATLKEYDEKMIVEIYKSLMAQGQLVAGGTQGGQMVPRR